MRIRIGLSLGAAGAPDQFEASAALLEAVINAAADEAGRQVDSDVKTYSLSTDAW